MDSHQDFHLLLFWDDENGPQISLLLGFLFSSSLTNVAGWMFGPSFGMTLLYTGELSLHLGIGQRA